MQRFKTILLFITINYIKTTEEAIDNNSENPLVSFRLKMEELPEYEPNKIMDDSSDALVSFLVENIKELFINTDNSTITTETTDQSFDSASLFDVIRKPTISYLTKKSLSSSIEEPKFIYLLKPEERYNLFNRPNKSDKKLTKSKNGIEVNTSNQFGHNGLRTSNSSISSISTFTSTNRLGISCIVCDNVINEDCSNPKFKLIPSIVCERENDLCYSQHTPFGIIDRGCFNINHNLTLFVCACNLCNYISISEMPYIFSNKREWIENVIELSRAKRFRESIFKDMSCLRCEVNVTAKTGDATADVNCLEGDIELLPHQVCASDEICAVKAVRSEGYIWRGCSSEPLYNYWWTLCDSDLCNYDSIVSVYEYNYDDGNT